MFGRTARRIKSVTTWSSTPASCEFGDARVETDGWYVDLLYGLECSADISGASRSMGIPTSFSTIPPGKCGERIIKDKYRFEQKTVGTARLGFPILLTQMFYDARGRSSSRTEEVTELVDGELDASLFEAPHDYKPVQPKIIKRVAMSASRFVNMTTAAR